MDVVMESQNLRMRKAEESQGIQNLQQKWEDAPSTSARQPRRSFRVWSHVTLTWRATKCLRSRIMMVLARWICSAVVYWRELVKGCFITSPALHGECRLRRKISLIVNYTSPIRNHFLPEKQHRVGYMHHMTHHLSLYQPPTM